MSISIHNTASRQKEIFASITPGEVKMYVCGPTVYDFLHIGNFRGPIFFNLVRNWFERVGYKVTYVYNYTDVDDKIINRANKEKVESSAIAEKYIQEFENDFKKLNLTPHDHNPRVTQYIPQIIKIIEKLIENGKAYVVQGEVIYAVDSFEGYGKLSGKNIEDLKAGIRVEIDSKKKNPLDFALWKPSKPGEPKWPSPWGDGRPGWHIECSAMASSILGDTFDIHGGGIDLIFPHHENEIAQSEGASKHPFVKYWMHNNFINFGAHKMSKSLGNFTTARAFLTKYNGEILKYMILYPHYRTHSDFSASQISHAIAGLARVYSALSHAEEIVGQLEIPKATRALTSTEPLIFGQADQVSGISEDFKKTLVQASLKAEKALADDFNTPEFFAAVFEVVRAFNAQFKVGSKPTPAIAASAQAFVRWVRDAGGALALFQEASHDYLKLLDDMLLEEKKVARAEVDQIIVERTAARASKNYQLSDELRDKLKNIGIEVHDSPQGTRWEVQK